MWFFSILKCSEDSEIPNSIFYVVGVRYKFIWQNATEPFSKMPEAKKTNTLIEKTILLQKSLQNHMKKAHRTVFQNAWTQKNQHSQKNQVC